MAPRHIAISLEKDVRQWAEKNSRDLALVYEGRTGIVEEIVSAQIRLNIPIITVFLLKAEGDIKDREIVIDSLAALFERLSQNTAIIQNQVRITVFGKWYELPNRNVEAIKRCVEQTEGFDGFFLNFCVFYDGREEIVDSCRLIGRKVKAEKIDADAVDSEMVREGLYSSYFLPPELVIINGDKRLNGFLLWDVAESRLYFTEKEWPEFNAFDLKKAIDLFELVE
jgi:tritrans,polycis-undecaprenyl-diphosphate synthase [geranylgeranyl-diphosphate specific]